MASAPKVKLAIDTRDFERSVKMMAAAMKRFGASIPRVHTLDASSPIHDQLALDFLMCGKANALRAEADASTLVRRLYLRSVARGLSRKPKPYRELERVGGRS